MNPIYLIQERVLNSASISTNGIHSARKRLIRCSLSKYDRMKSISCAKSISKFMITLTQKEVETLSRAASVVALWNSGFTTIRDNRCLEPVTGVYAHSHNLNSAFQGLLNSKKMSSKIVTIVCGPRRSGRSTFLRRIGCQEIIYSQDCTETIGFNIGFETCGDYLWDLQRDLLNDASQIRIYSMGSPSMDQNLMNLLTEDQKSKISHYVTPS